MTEPINPAPEDVTRIGQPDPSRTNAADAATLPPSSQPHMASSPLLTSTRERYALGCEVARGGMGAILRATDLSIERTVAMKVALDPASMDAEILQRFTLEAKLTGQLEHPNIVPVYDLSSDDHDRPFYTMKFVTGVTLHEILSKLKDSDAATVAQYSLAQLLTIFQKVCDAVAFAHSRNVIHRDLKPANIMVGEYGEVLVMDWGLAKVVGGERSAISGQRSAGGEKPSWARVSDPAHPPTEGLVVPQKTCGPEIGDRRQTELAALNAQLSPLNSQPAPALTLAGQIMGSPQYMAPEQAAGELDKFDARTDIFALGGILYHILTLHPPVSGKSVEEMLEKILAGEILPPSSYNTKTGRKLGGTIKVGEKTFPQPPLIPLRHCPEGRIPESLGAVAMKALALKQEDRYLSVPELQKDIAAYQGGFATGAEKASAWRQLALLVKRHKKEFTLAAVALVMLVGTVTGFLVKVTKERNRAESNERQAQLERQRAETNERQAETERRRAEIEKTHAQTERDRAERTLVELHKTAPTFFAQAQVLTEQYRWPEAMEKIRFAVSLAPEVTDYHVVQGNLLQTELRMTEASAAYAAALQQQPDHKVAKENLELCQAFLRDKAAPQHLTSLKPIHDAMLRQRRTAEAGAFMRFISKVTTDRSEVLTAWRKVLDGAGLNSNFLQYTDEGLTLNIPMDTVYTNDTLAVFQGMPLNSISLGYSAPKVRDLSRLEGMPLHTLNLLDAPITNLSPLQGMQLKHLAIGRCKQVTDLSPLRGMPLEYLNLTSLPITNLSVLRGMPLTELRLDLTKVTDLTPLAGMNLTRLDIYSTKVSDLSPLRGMPIKWLCANYTSVTDLSPLKGMALEHLDLAGGYVKDFSPILGMPLTALTLNLSQIDDLTPLKGMRLKTLFLLRCPITDLSPLRGMPLKDLDLLECEKLQDLTPLTECPQLERVFIPATCKNIECLRAHPTLRQIGTSRGPNAFEGLPTVAEFWKAYDAQKAGGVEGKPMP